MNTTSADELRQRIEEKRYNYFTFPVLNITIKYRRPDLLKLSFNNSLPSALAAVVIEGYKEAVGGTTIEDYQQKMQDKKIETNDELIKDLGKKGYTLLSELSVSHKFMDVPESDFDASPIALISWVDVPEEDAIAFLMHIIQRAQVAKNASGGETSNEDVASFPDSRPVPQRNSTGKSRKAVR
jgi:hypothetical protein